MATRRALVVGETPSLGRAIWDLLDVGGVAAEYVGRLEDAAPLPDPPSEFPVVIAAASGPYCATARTWSQGVGPGTALIVVGSRDPAVARLPRVHQVPLPLVPDELLSLVRRLLDRTGTAPP